MKINWKVRFKNPLFIVELILAICVPILAYMGITVQELTSWEKLFSVVIDAVSNPYVLGLAAVSVFNSLTDPTSKGIGDNEKIQ